MEIYTGKGCPDDFTITCFIEEGVGSTRKETKSIRKHLLKCDRCLMVYSILKGDKLTELYFLNKAELLLQSF